MATAKRESATGAEEFSDPRVNSQRRRAATGHSGEGGATDFAFLAAASAYRHALAPNLFSAVHFPESRNLSCRNAFATVSSASVAMVSLAMSQWT
jgi:hypothetical protein